MDKTSPRPPDANPIRPSKTVMEVTYRLRGREGLAVLLRAAGWMTAACPLCPPRDRFSIKAWRSWKAACKLAKLGQPDPPCELCHGTRRIRLAGTFTKKNETVYPDAR